MTLAKLKLKMNKELKIKKIDIADKEYPKQLKKIANPPKVLYYRGNLSALNYKYSVAVVGTRRCSQYGKEATQQITKKLSQAGVTIISGLARGVDTWAHKTALEYGTLARRSLGEGGPTIAVLGTGVDDKSLYPKQNLLLAHKIINENGLVISEYEEGTQGFPGNFPARNRIVAALSDATLVTEAPLKSGALITAEFAKKYNKKVYAVPGSIFSRLSSGTNYLLQNGANAAVNGEIILKDLGVKEQSQQENLKLNLNELELVVLKLIKDAPTAMHIDKIIQKVKVDFSEVSVAVTSLVLNDLIKEAGTDTYIATSQFSN